MPSDSPKVDLPSWERDNRKKALWGKKPTGKEKVDLHIRLDPELHEELRRLAYEQRRSLNSIALEAIQQLVTQKHVNNIIAGATRKQGNE